MAIPVHLISGFLGSGKSTFLNNYLNYFGTKGRKIAVIQNEFAATGIDGRVVAQNSHLYSLLEVNNGSVFCLCLLGSFIDSLAQFLEANDVDEIIMEASGMSDPTGIGQIFQSPKLRGKVSLGHCWTLVDVHNFHKLSSIKNRIDLQIRVADTVILNKADLAPDAVGAIRDSVKRVNPFVSIVETSFASVDFEAMKQSKKFYLSDLSEGCGRPDIESFVIRSERIITMEQLHDFLGQVRADLIRIKGFVNCEGEKKMMIQGVFDDFVCEEVGWFGGVTEIVGIGKLDPDVDYTRLFEKFTNG